MNGTMSMRVIYLRLLISGVLVAIMLALGTFDFPGTRSERAAVSSAHSGR